MVVMATLFGFIENSDSIRLFADPKNPILFTVTIFRFPAQNWNQCKFGWRLLKFGCHGNSFCALKYSDNMWIRRFLRPCCSREKFFSILNRSEISAILACFAYLVAPATLYVPWKIQIAYLNSTTPKPYNIWENGTILRTELKSAYIWPFI